MTRLIRRILAAPFWFVFGLAAAIGMVAGLTAMIISGDSRV